MGCLGGAPLTRPNRLGRSATTPSGPTGFRTTRLAWANEEATRIERDVIAAEVDELRTKREAAEWREAVKKANSLPSAGKDVA